MSICNMQDAVRDYAMGETPAPGVETHLNTCHGCAEEFDQLRVTTAALRVLPDQEIPQRIAFISDKIFKPSFFAGFWKAAMVSASLLASAVIIAHRPAPSATVVQASAPAPDVSRQIEEAVAKVRREDDRRLRTIEAAAQINQQKEHQAVMEAINILQERQNAATLLAVADTTRQGAGQ